MSAKYILNAHSASEASIHEASAFAACLAAPNYIGGTTRPETNFEAAGPPRVRARRLMSEQRRPARPLWDVSGRVRRVELSTAWARCQRVHGVCNTQRRELQGSARLDDTAMRGPDPVRTPRLVWLTTFA
jgi:hypothetical protein